MPGHKNWISYLEDQQVSFLRFDFANMQNMNKNEAIANNIEKIYQDHGDNIYVALSGGMDSEFVANCIRDSGKPFKVIMVDYFSNSCELWYAKKWCYENNITPEIIKLSISDMETRVVSICKKYKCTYISAIDFIIKEYVESKGAKFIGGGPEPFPRNNCFNDNLIQLLSENLQNTTIYFKFCEIINNSHPYKFMMYTPEMLYNMVKEIDYTKPSQIAIANYYGIEARPKIPYGHLWPVIFPKLKNIESEINAASYYRILNIGTKEGFLSSADSRKQHNAVNTIT